MYGQQPANNERGRMGPGEGIGSRGQGQASETGVPSSNMPPTAGGMLSGSSGMNSVTALGQGGEMAGRSESMSTDDLSNPAAGQPGSEGTGGGSDPNFGPQASMMANDPGASGMQMDPMMMARDQFQQLIEAVQLVGEMYPMASEFVNEASEALVNALIAVAEGIQQPPQAPPIAV